MEMEEKKEEEEGERRGKGEIFVRGLGTESWATLALTAILEGSSMVSWVAEEEVPWFCVGGVGLTGNGQPIVETTRHRVPLKTGWEGRDGKRAPYRGDGMALWPCDSQKLVGSAMTENGESTRSHEPLNTVAP